VLGETSLSGGYGTIAGTLIGALIIGVINNGMNLLSIPYFYQLIVKGGRHPGRRLHRCSNEEAPWLILNLNCAGPVRPATS
jgi:hypothetical protein